jgi:hypothetical protein
MEQGARYNCISRLANRRNACKIRRVLRFLRIILVIAGCIHLSGGHHGVLQAIAWGKMIVDYSSEKGLKDGIRETFDGKHPCDLCRSIAANREESDSPLRQSPQDVAGLKLKDVLPCRILELRKPRSTDLADVSFSEPDPGLHRFRPAPDMPPPRNA